VNAPEFVCFAHNALLVLLLFIHSSMALQPFAGPWSLLQFRNLFLHRRYVSLDEWSARRKPLPEHWTTQTQNKRIDRHALSRIRTHDLCVRASLDSSCFKPHGHNDRPPRSSKTLISLALLLTLLLRLKFDTMLLLLTDFLPPLDISTR
jgi:hypothetical protein